MKKTLLLLTLSFAVLFSCSSGEDKNNSTEDNSLLLRRWYIVSVTSNGNTFNQGECSNGNRSYITFSEPNFYGEYTWESDDNCDYFLTESGTWSRDGLIISIETQYESYTITIDELTATTFSFVTSGGLYYVYTSLN